MDIEAGTLALEACNGGGVQVQGRVTVTAVQTVDGILSGDASTPAVPVTDAPAQIRFEDVLFDDFRIVLQSDF